MIETTDTQLIAGNAKCEWLRMFNFVDKAEKDKTSASRKTVEETQAKMKELFREVNEDPQYLKTNKAGLKKYF